MERITSFTKEAWGAGARGARTAAGAGVHTTYGKGAEFTENTGDAVNNLFNRAELIQRGFFRALVSEEDGTGDPEENRVQMDGTFGAIGPTHVCLRIETAEHWELKLAKYVSRAFTLLIVAVIIALICLKTTTRFSKIITSNTYYIWNVAVAGACWALCALTLVSYAHRYRAAQRLDMQWSNRRWRLSLQALALLVVQMFNLSFMLVGLSLIIPEPCRWRNYASSIMGLLQWTCWNTEFMILVAMAHSLTIVRRKKGDRKEGADGLAASRPTSFHSAFRSTMRSTVRSMSMGLSMTRVKGMELVMDTPIYRTVSVEKVLMWIFFQIWPTLLVWSFWGFLTNSCGARLPFQDGDAVCTVSDKTVAFLAMNIAAVGMYMVVYLFFSSRTQDDLESRSYAEMRFVRIAFGVQHSYVLPLFLVLTVSIIVLTSIKIDSCWTYVEEWLGLSAWQAAGTICACTMSYFYMPLVGRDRGVILSLLQDFCWNQKALEMEKEARDEILKRVVNDDRATKSPIFCVETCIRHLYLANYVYSCEYDRGGDGSGDEATVATTSDEIETAPSKPSEPSISSPSSPLSPDPPPTPGCGNLDDALAIWEADVEDYRVISEPLTDTVALVLWNKNRIALAFKGTSSAQNVKTDLNVFKVVHEPRRKVEVSAGFTKSLSIPQTPYVHKGFWKSWTEEDFHLRIKDVVREYIDTHHDKREANERVEMHVTGHSLGGALATLAALDLTREFDVDTTVYTFGQPRVGNKAFATDYDAAVPRHFSVAHGQDPVARVPKGAYRKNGIRVFTSQAGDVIVSPSSLETHVINSTPVVADHFLESYRKAWMASIKQQFGPKSLSGLSQSGRDGALELASEIELGTALLGTNLDVSALESFDTHPLSEEDQHKIKLKEEKGRAKQEGREKKEGDGGDGWLPAGCAPGCAGRPKTAE